MLVLCLKSAFFSVFFFYFCKRKKRPETERNLFTKIKKIMKRNYFILLISAIFLFSACGETGKEEIKTSENNSTEKTTSEEKVEISDPVKKKLYETAIRRFIEIKDAEPVKDEVQKAKISLGKALYFDNRLSKDNKQSCNTCHNLSTFGVDNLATSPGNDGKFGNRNSPSVLYASLHRMQFWDGRAADVEQQAGMPITNPVEMAIPDEKFLIDRLSKIEGYKTMFKAAFPESQEPITYENLRIAIAAFERTLNPVSKFDKYLAGDVAQLNEQEASGLQLFFDKGCVACHSGQPIGGELMMRFGLHKDYPELTGSKVVDFGKFEITKNQNDYFVFKVPSLRNIEKTGPYFHDGSVKELEKAVEIMLVSMLIKEPVAKEISDITAFLKTLTADLDQETKKSPEMPK